MKCVKNTAVFFFLCFFSIVWPVFASPLQIMDGTFLLRSRHEILDGQIKTKILSDKVFAAQHKAMRQISPQMVEGQTTLTFQCYNFASGQYERRDATLKLTGQHCYIFVANDSSSLLTDPATTIEQIRKTFDEKIYPDDINWFGSLTIPATFGLPDEKIYILLEDIRDGLGSGYVAGYFDSRDLEGDFGNRKPLFFMDLNPGKTGDPNNKNNDF